MPKIASYPFTTLHPHIGKIKFDDSSWITLADLPGLIEGAHANKGLGHKFLKHVERTKLLLFLLDGSLDPYEKRSPINDLNCLFQELSLFNKTFSEKPFMIALNKSDINQENHKKNLELLRSSDIFRKAKIMSISGKEAIGLEELVLGLKDMADELRLRHR